MNEAFTVVPLMFQRSLVCRRSGATSTVGPLPLDTPLGSTGARMLTDLLCGLERSGQRIGLQTIYEAGGAANAT